MGLTLTKADSKNLIDGKTCMITGANSGIGKATAIGLAKLGAHLVLVCRNHKRADAAIKDIKKKVENESIDLLLADLSSQEEIHRVVNEFKSRYEKLDVLINNVGVTLPKRTLTVDGIETTFAVNYLSYFMLSILLFDVLNKGNPARIVNVASMLQAKTINFDVLYKENDYTQLKAYSLSKLAVILFTREFARRLNGTRITINCLHPGVAKTKIVRNFRPFVKYFYPLIGLFMKRPKKAAKTSIFLASSPEVNGISGKYFKKQKEAKSVKISYDEEAAKKIWEISVELTNIDFKR